MNALLASILVSSSPLITTAPASSLRELWQESRRSTPVITSSSDGVHRGYQKDPVRWQVEMLGIPEHTIKWSLNPRYQRHKWDGTRDPLVAALEGLAAGEDVGVEAGTGTQKTYVLGAGAMLWFLGCFENALVVTLAPKEDQLKLHLWKEARKLWPKFKLRFPGATLTDLKLRMRGGLDEAWTATGFVAGVGSDEETAGRARGFHAEHALYIFEESPGVHAAIGSAIDFTCTAPHNVQLRLGNPDNEQDELHRFCKRKGVRHVRISALDHPNVVTGDASIVPGAASRISVGKVRELHGEGSDSFNAKVRGIAPKQSADSLIRWEWLELAASRYNDPLYRAGLPGIGCDVADSTQGDEACIARGLGACLVELDAFQIGQRGIHDASQLGAQLGLEIQLEGIDELHVGVDSVGVGASTINKLKELGFLVQALNGGAKAIPKIDEDVLRETGKGVQPEELYGDLRSQMYWQMRQDLLHGRIAVLEDDELFRDLTFVKWERRGGKIAVEPKESPTRGGQPNKNWGVKQRLGRSPNKGDAAVYWNWVRHRRAVQVEQPAESAFSKSRLAREAKESRRVRDKKPNTRKIPITAIEHID